MSRQALPVAGKNVDTDRKCMRRTPYINPLQTSHAQCSLPPFPYPLPVPPPHPPLAAPPATCPWPPPAPYTHPNPASHVRRNSPAGRSLLCPPPPHPPSAPTPTRNKRVTSKAGLASPTRCPRHLQPPAHGHLHTPHAQHGLPPSLTLTPHSRLPTHPLLAAPPASLKPNPNHTQACSALPTRRPRHLQPPAHGHLHAAGHHGGAAGHLTEARLQLHGDGVLLPLPLSMLSPLSLPPLVSSLPLPLPLLPPLPPRQHHVQPPLVLRQLAVVGAAGHVVRQALDLHVQQR